MKKLFLFLFLVAQISNAESKSAINTWEIRTAPVAMLAKWITLDLSYLQNHFAFGPSAINYASPETNGGMLAPTYNGSAFGVHAIYADSFYKDSFYVSAHAYLENYKSYPHAFLGYENKKGSKANFDVGHRWVRGNLTSMLGLGFESQNHSIETVSGSGITTNGPDENSSLFHIEFKIGYLF